MPEQTASYPAQYGPSRCPRVCAEALFDRLQHLSRTSEPDIPALATAVQAMISRSKASIMNG